MRTDVAELYRWSDGTHIVRALTDESWRQMSREANFGHAIRLPLIHFFLLNSHRKAINRLSLQILDGKPFPLRTDRMVGPWQRFFSELKLHFTDQVEPTSSMGQPQASPGTFTEMPHRETYLLLGIEPLLFEDGLFVDWWTSGASP